MKPGGAIAVAAAARLFGPLLALFAFSLFAARAPGEGVGLLAGLAFGLVIALHALTFGVAATKRAAPPFAARIVLSLGLAGAIAGAAAPALPFNGQIIEAALFAVTAAASALIVVACFGRVPTLRDAEW